MASNNLENVVGAFSTRQEAEYACRALIQIAGIDRSKISVLPSNSTAANELENAESYLVMLEDSPSVVAQAKVFLQGPTSQEHDEDAEAKQEARQAALRVKMLRNISNSGLV